MTPEEIDELVEWNRNACHAKGCHNAAERVYFWRQQNAHGGESTFRSQRCADHPIDKAFRVTNYVRRAPSTGETE